MGLSSAQPNAMDVKRKQETASRTEKEALKAEWEEALPRKISPLTIHTLDV